METTMMKMDTMMMMMEKRKITRAMKERKKGIPKMILRLMVQVEVMMGTRMTMTMRKMMAMKKTTRTKTTKRKRRRLHSHHLRRESENYIGRTLFPWNGMPLSRA